MTPLPSVHLNGTSKQELFDTYFEALDAIATARVALQKAAPNGRDYYPQGPGFYEKARQDHERRLRLLETIYNELHTIAEHVQP